MGKERRVPTQRELHVARVPTQLQAHAGAAAAAAAELAAAAERRAAAARWCAAAARGAAEARPRRLPAGSEDGRVPRRARCARAGPMMGSAPPTAVSESECSSRGRAKGVRTAAGAKASVAKKEAAAKKAAAEFAAAGAAAAGAQQGRCVDSYRDCVSIHRRSTNDVRDAVRAEALRGDV